MSAIEDPTRMTSRSTDASPVKISRELPLWAVIVTIVTWIFSAGGLYAGIREQTRAISDLAGTVRALQVQVATKDVKDAEHDTRLGILDRELQDVRARLTRLEERR